MIGTENSDATAENRAAVPEPSTEIADERLVEGAYCPPESIIDEPWFICYRIEEKPDGRVAKVPKDPSAALDGDIVSADVTDPGVGVDYYSALGAVDESSKQCCGEDGFKDALDGVGVLLGPSDLVGIDMDHIRTEDGQIEEFALELVRSIGSFAEISPSSDGIHVLAEGGLDEDFGNRNDEIGLEMYDSSRFFTLSCRSLKTAPTEIIEAGDVVRRYQRAWIGETAGSSSTDSQSISELTGTDPTATPELEMDENEIVEEARSADPGFDQLWRGITSGYESRSEADFSAACKAAYWAKSDVQMVERILRSSALAREKWDESRGSQTYLEMTIENAIQANGR
jgi:primase-polymerase (primpol)-like protein